MSAVRLLLLRHRMAACWLVAIALAIRVLVPAGFMPAAGGGAMSLMPCDGHAAPAATAHAAMAHHGGDHHPDPHAGPRAGSHAAPHKGHDGHDHRDDDGRDRTPCAFTGLHAQALGAVDAVLMAAAIAFVLAGAFRPFPAPALRTAPFLRPPLRGPPAA